MIVTPVPAAIVNAAVASVISTIHSLSAVNPDGIVRVFAVAQFHRNRFPQSVFARFRFVDSAVSTNSPDDPPFCPVTPVSPVGPVAPVNPVSPVGPVGPEIVDAAPVGPVSPVGPVGPVGPLIVDAAPVDPVGPVGPVGPLGPELTTDRRPLSSLKLKALPPPTSSVQTFAASEKSPEVLLTEKDAPKVPGVRPMRTRPYLAGQIIEVM